MNQRTLETLEYAKVKSQMRDLAACSLGKARIDAMVPFTVKDDAEHELAVVDEALQMLYRFGPLPFGGVTDIRSALRKAEIGGVLGTDELNRIVDFIQGGRRVRQALQVEPEQLDVPRLRQTALQLFDARKTEEEIRKAVGDDGTVWDHASPELARLRNQRRQLESRMRQQLEQMLRSHARYLQDPVIAMRGNNLCLPVRLEYKNQVQGIVHDVSASGATVFVEPQSVVESGARVRGLLVEEEREVERILQKLSGLVAEVAEELEENVAALGEVDQWFAKAAWARKEDCERPVLRQDGVWILRHARHPLIAKAQAVPIDLSLGDHHQMLIITGPNTGGKTVTLKTVGILTLLAMSGSFLPSRQPCDIGWCDDIFADIGDEQSIEQSLSTFSSHLRNIVQMFRQVTMNSLVLLDELGAGTDPAEGAALSMAILDHLKALGAKVVATTHYAELKVYAMNDSALINASMEFDVETLQPTYRLRLGVPGRSNALAIAQRLGLHASIIEQARAYVRTDDARIDALIESMEKAQRETERLHREADIAKRNVKALEAELERREAEFHTETDKLRQQAAAEARTIVERAKQESERIIRELRSRRDSGQVKDHELVELRKGLESALPRELERIVKKVRQREQIKVGAIVRVASLGQKGEVVEMSDDGETLTVQLGLLKMKVKQSDIELLQNADGSNSSGAAAGGRSVKRGLPRQMSLQLDIRGETVEEAISRIDKYLDDAVMNGLARVTIVHGKGTGALRDGVRRYLSRHAQVKEWIRGGPGEGGDGATLVTLQ
ncbi:endonuclease MutS2 [Alicyclobacillus mengziensis]|uniref:Endonuclease MutS2 n=1 Tax=Alicyclobacillus mengziensis TaxID=2931921 RepID=A0A9X7VW98_9BACL|nr:endonuclease MutS2 [Alicyclobacillus mengziensis]QSO46251.1 endonuclease MutS2 [Alicyclobacillus mengziensis]